VSAASRRNEEGGAFDINPEDIGADLHGTVSGQPAKYTLLSLEELLALPLPKWVIRKVMRQGDLVVVYGEPGCGKTFVVVALALCVAAGLEWYGYRTTIGNVVYLAGEGCAGLGRRVQAWGTDFPLNLEVLKADVRVLPHSIQFMDNPQFDRLVTTLKEEVVKPAAVIVDTLARYMVGGEENSAKDMGIFVKRCERLRDATDGATVIVVHHKSKNSNVERGSTALRGAADVMLEVTSSGEKIEIKGDKAKDSDRLPTIHLRKRVVHLGLDEEEEDVTSLVLDLVKVAPSGGEQTEADSSRESSTAADPGTAIRQVLATLFGGKSAGEKLLAASGLKRSPFYRALTNEIKAERIETVEEKRYPEYRLTAKAPEYRSPSPSPSESQNSNGTPGESQRESQSQSHHPRKGGDWNGDSDSDSTSHRAKKARRNRKATEGEDASRA
jgi:hypothetical protein